MCYYNQYKESYAPVTALGNIGAHTPKMYFCSQLNCLGLNTHKHTSHKYFHLANETDQQQGLHEQIQFFILFIFFLNPYSKSQSWQQ